MKRTIAVICLLGALLAARLQAGEIHDAAAAGDLNKVKALLEADPTLLESKDDRNQGNLKNNTPLISACWGPDSNNWQATVASYLIDMGANINARNDMGATPLYFAVKDFDLAQRLIAKGADVNIRAFGDYTPLHLTAASGNLRVAKLLIDHGADPNANGSVGTVLQFMIRLSRPNEQMAKLLVENGAKLNQKFSLGNTELHLSVLQGSEDWTQILVKLGADVNAVNDYGHTPLYYAAKHGYLQAADVLIAAGANQSAIVETNYGKAPQLNEKLKQGEAYLWYLGGTESPYAGYAVKTKEHLLIFNPPVIDDSPEAGLANGHLNPNELAGQKITALILYPSYQGPSARPSISELGKKLRGINVVLNYKPTGDAGSNDLPPYHLATPHESFSVDGVQVHTIPAVRKLWFSSEGLGYLVEADGVKVFHAGAHAPGNEASELEKYRKEIDYLKSFGPIDIAILPVNGRHMWWIDYQSYLYLIDQLSPKAIYLIGDDLAKGEHRKCVEVLRARNVPVFYPEGGIAVGERFHFPRPEKYELTDLKGDYLGQTPPGDGPVVLAPGIVSTIYMEHSAPAFSPDGNEVFWHVAKGFVSAPDVTISPKTMKRINGRWTVPMDSPYGGAPAFSPDGKRLYFSQLPPGNKPDGPYFVEKQGSGWSEPHNVGLVARFPDLMAVHGPTVTRDGTLYFAADIASQGRIKDHRIYRSRLRDGNYSKPELLPRCINLPDTWNYTPFIAPDESYLLFSSNRPGSLDDNGDLYVSFHDIEKDTWSEPVSLGEPINTRGQESNPGVSPDGKYLFFTGPSASNQADVYWVSASVLEPLRLQARGWTNLTGDYLGQKPPGATPQIFAPGLISKDGLLDGGPYFTPDGNEVIWRENLPPGPDKGWVFRAWTMRRQNGVWSAPYPPPFAGTGSIVLSPDGQRAYFSPFHSGAADDIWFAERQGDSWSEPKCLGFVSRWPELKYAYAHSIARNGNLYFVGYAPGLFDNSGIYRSRLVNGEYTKPELLPRNINLPPFLNWTPFVAPDESYLLFSSTRTGSHGLADLFISFRNPDGSWTDPIGLGDSINTEEQERYPAVSPDGKYLFFTRGHDAVHNVFWVDASVLEPLRLQAHGWTNLSGDYLGQKPPGATPQVFARGIVSTDDLEHSAPAFSPDGNEVFWSLWRRPDKGEPQVIMTMRREGGTWSAPTVAPFSGKFIDGGPVFSVDGRRIYFYSTRPTPAGTTSDDIWFVEKQNNVWSEPRCLGFVARFSEMKAVYQPSITRNGTLYFISRPKITPIDNTLEGPPNPFLIYRAELINGEYRKPELLPPSINAPDAYVNWTPFIAPDESYLIFSSGRRDNHGGGDLYVSFRNVDGSWTDPISLGEAVNTDKQERFPSVSPDGKYLFFTRPTPDHSHDVFWVSASVLEPLRLEARGWNTLTGDYLGQTPPGATPEVFARGIVSTDDKEHGVPAFSPNGNEVFWLEARPPGPNNSEWLTWEMTMRRENGRWSAPRLSLYPSLPTYSADGKRLYFGAPRPGATREDGEQDIWVVEKQAEGWSEPKCLNLISQSPELQLAAWPTIARNGNLYFISSVPEQRNKLGIARSEFVNGQYSKPELLPKHTFRPFEC